jgi:hypothetical protein
VVHKRVGLNDHTPISLNVLDVIKYGINYSEAIWQKMCFVIYLYPKYINRLLLLKNNVFFKLFSFCKSNCSDKQFFSFICDKFNPLYNKCTTNWYFFPLFISLLKKLMSCKRDSIVDNKRHLYPPKIRAKGQIFL